MPVHDNNTPSQKQKSRRLWRKKSKTGINKIRSKKRTHKTNYRKTEQANRKGIER